jgi:hypothetical protein
MSELLRYLAILSLSPCTGFYFSKVLELFPQNGAPLPSLERARFIFTNALAFSVSGRGCEGCSGIAPRRYCKETLLRFKSLIESRRLYNGCYITNGTFSSSCKAMGFSGV